MTLVEKIERALTLAKELGLNDHQTKELMALVLELQMPFTFRVADPMLMPIISPLPYIPQYPDTVTYTNNDPMSCACSPIGQPHSDACKSSDGLFDVPRHQKNDHQ